jgi:hypothetical protein
MTGLAGFCPAPQKQGRVEVGMPREEAHQFQAGVSGRTQHGGLKFSHQVATPLLFKNAPNA